MHIVAISAAIGIALGWLAAHFFTGVMLVILTLTVALIVLYGWGDAKKAGPSGGAAALGMLMMFGPGIVCFLATMWGVHLYFALASPDIDWDAVRGLIFR